MTHADVRGVLGHPEDTRPGVITAPVFTVSSTPSFIVVDKQLIGNGTDVGPPRSFDLVLSR